MHSLGDRTDGRQWRIQIEIRPQVALSSSRQEGIERDGIATDDHRRVAKVESLDLTRDECCAFNSWQLGEGARHGLDGPDLGEGVDAARFDSNLSWQRGHDPRAQPSGGAFGMSMLR